MLLCKEKLVKVTNLRWTCPFPLLSRCAVLLGCSAWWQERDTVRYSESAVGKQRTMYLFCSAGFLLLIQFWTPGHRMVHPHLWLPFYLHCLSLEISSTHMARILFSLWFKIPSRTAGKAAEITGFLIAQLRSVQNHHFYFLLIKDLWIPGL